MNATATNNPRALLSSDKAIAVVLSGTPTVLAFLPPSAAATAGNGGVFTVKFSENIRTGTGTAHILDANRIVIAGDNSAGYQVYVMGNTLRIDPFLEMTPGTYIFQLSADFITDLDGNALAAPFTAIFTVAPSRSATAGADVLAAVSAGEAIDGLAGDDVLSGSGSGDALYGSAGNDRLDGGGGDDALYDFAGNNIFDGGAGADLLLSRGMGTNRLAGGDGDDWISAGRGNDTLDGGAGDDQLVVDIVSTWPLPTLDTVRAPNTVHVDGGDGNDKVTVFQGPWRGATVIARGGAGVDTFIPFGEADASFTITDFSAGAGGDVIDLTRHFRAGPTAVLSAPLTFFA